MKVEVVYALPKEQTVLELDVPEGTTALQVVEQSGILKQYPELVAQDLSLGIFSKACDHDQVVKAGERVEIYRPLLADPKEIRKRRAAEMAAKKAAQKAARESD
jgi:putative ubiquitin-RnfH superfamily antitoxin RatB of RatAB toxin-antitoxin module